MAKSIEEKVSRIIKNEQRKVARQDKDELVILANLPPAMTLADFNNVNWDSVSTINVIKIIRKQQTRLDGLEALRDALDPNDTRVIIYNKQIESAVLVIEKLSNLIEGRDTEQDKQVLKNLKRNNRNGQYDKEIQALKTEIKKKKQFDSILLKTKNFFSSDMKFLLRGNGSKLGRLAKVGKIYASSDGIKTGIKYLSKRLINKASRGRYFDDVDSFMSEYIKAQNSATQARLDAKQLRDNGITKDSTNNEVKSDTKVSTMNNRAKTDNLELAKFNVEQSRKLLVDADDDLLRGLDKHFKVLGDKLKDRKSNDEGKGLLGSLTSMLGGHTKLIGNLLKVAAVAFGVFKIFGADDAEASLGNLNMNDVDKYIDNINEQNVETEMKMTQEPLPSKSNEPKNDSWWGKLSNVASKGWEVATNAYHTVKDSFSDKFSSDYKSTGDYSMIDNSSKLGNNGQHKNKVRNDVYEAGDAVFGNNELLKVANAAIVRGESSFNSGASNRYSSAVGTHQFLNATWLTQIKNHASEYAPMLGVDEKVLKNIRKGGTYGMTTGDVGLDYRLIKLKSNSKISSRVGADFMMDNKNWYESKGYGPITENNVADLYAIHHLGQGDFEYFMNRWNVPIRGDAHFIRVASSNPFLRGCNTGGDVIKAIRNYFSKNLNQELSMRQEDIKTQLAYNEKQNNLDLASSQVDNTNVEVEHATTNSTNNVEVASNEGGVWNTITSWFGSDNKSVDKPKLAQPTVMASNDVNMSTPQDKLHQYTPPRLAPSSNTSISSEINKQMASNSTGGNDLPTVLIGDGLFNLGNYGTTI